MTAAAEEVTRARSVAVLDFLSDLHALKYQPVRRLEEHQQFVARDARLAGVRGLTLHDGDEPVAPTGTWLRHELLEPEPAPAPPTQLERWLATPFPSDGPPRLAELEPPRDVPAEVREVYDLWLAEEWQPWHGRSVEIARSRALYRELFEVRALLHQNGDTLEMRLGLWDLRWVTAGLTFDHPVLTCPVEVTYDEKRAVISIDVVGGLELEYDLFGEVGLADREGMVRIRHSLEEAPPTPWDPPEVLRDLAARVARATNHDAAIVEERSGAPGATPTLAPGWVLFVRRKPTDYKGFVEALRDAYVNGADIPTPFASTVVEEPSVLPVESGGSWDPPGGWPLLPLPANAEQYQILDRINRANGVTAQGPPGTGKSHTIANLISHFVAVGKRVLVVAEKEQALSVLLEKVPADIRDLCVAVIGTDSTSKSRIEHSIRAIYDGAFGLDPAEAQREIGLLVAALDKVDRDISAVEAQIRDAVEAEGTPAPGSGERSPSVVATWLREERDALGYVDDVIEANSVAPPLSAAEAVELWALVARIDPADRSAAAAGLPAESDLPAVEDLRVRSARRAELEAGLHAVEQWVPSPTAAAADLAAVEVIASELEAAAPDREAITSQPWLAAVEAQLADPAIAQLWSQFVAAVKTERDSLLDATRQLTGAQVELPGSAPLPPDQLELLRGVLRRFEAGKGLGRFGGKAEKALLESLRVAGYPPQDAAQVALCLRESERRAQSGRLRALWNEQVLRVGGPVLEPDADPAFALQIPLQWLEALLGWQPRWAWLVARVQGLGWTGPFDATPASLRHAAGVVRALAARSEVAQIDASTEEAAAALASGANGSGASPLWSSAELALRAGEWDRYAEITSEAARLRLLAPAVHRLEELHARLAVDAPVFAARVGNERGEGCSDPERFEQAWEWRRFDCWLDALQRRPSANELQARAAELSRERQRTVEQIVARSAWLQLSLQFTDAKRQALVEWINAHKKIGKGTGKYAGHWQSVAKEAMDRAKDAVPVWVMPVNTVIRSFKPGAEPPFDVLIVDEASQCGLFTLPMLALARKSIIVGDDKQTSPENVGFNREPVHQLIEQHLHDLPNRQTLFDIDTSLYDVAGQKFPGVVMLKEHFRCLPDIIEYSSRNFYDGKIECLRDTAPAPGWKAVESVFVPDGYKKRSDDSNPPEAEAIVGRIEKITLDPTYDGMSIGVVTLLGKGQAKLIDTLLLDRLGPQVIEERRIRCGEAAAFQGDERDVVLVSLVAARGDDGGRIGGMTGMPAQRRINVAASRAREQMIVFHSAQPEDFPAGDPRAELIRHCSDPHSFDVVMEGLAERCDSAFEREVLERILRRGYRRVRTQHPVGSYRIDIVVEGPDGRLAVECDGDRWHGPDRWDHDRSRQRVLERVGWKFVRIRGSAFYRDPEAALEPLWEELRRRGILTGEQEDLSATARPHGGDGDAPPDDEPEVPAAAAPVAPTPLAAPPDPFGGEDQTSLLDPEQARLPLAREPDPEPSAAAPPPPVAPTAVPPPAPTPPPAPVPDPATVPETAPDAPVAAPVDNEPASAGSAAPEVEPGDSGLAPYRAWTIRPVLHVEEASPAEVAAVLTEIVEVEGPIVARRAYLLYHQASGGQKLGKNVRSALNRALRRAVDQRQVLFVSDGHSGYIDKTLYLPGQPSVVVRQIGPRSFNEVPESEVAALALTLGLGVDPTDEVKRRVLSAYGLRRLTTGVSEHLDACFGSRRHGTDV